MEQNNNYSQPWQGGAEVPPQPRQAPMFPAGRKELWFAGVMLLCGLALANFVLFGGFNLGFSVAAAACI